MKKFKGTVTQISCSPHGRTEGLFLDGSIFVKIPPHTLAGNTEVTIGDEVSGEGEMKNSKLGKTVKHAKVFVNGNLFADGQMDEEEDEQMKKRHKKAIDSLKLEKEKGMSIEGAVVAVATKKHGEIDRIVLDGGVSVHVPKELELREEHLKIGDYLIVDGEGRNFGDRSFVRAAFVMNGDCQILTV